MSTEPFEKWLSDHGSSDWLWYVKRLSANDTLATGAHQAGPYFPKDVVFRLFPALLNQPAGNPRITIPVSLDSHGGLTKEISAIWYNEKTRNECRLTGWGGASSPLLDPEATGSVAVFAFFQSGKGNAEGGRAWLCSLTEEEVFEDLHGSVEPGEPVFMQGGHRLRAAQPPDERRPCWLTAETMPPEWGHQFPSGADIVARTVALRRLPGRSPDDRLLLRRECEFALFRSIEELVVLPRIKDGFKTVDEFIDYSNAVNNRRKSRSGRSLELQLVEIFKEEGVAFSHGEVSEGNKKPDFLFPSAHAYRSGDTNIRMLAAKTTCKDRWRQILNEADKVHCKHLVTLQEGISIQQFQEMHNAGVKLVVPLELHRTYPLPVRPSLISISAFISEVR